MGRRGILPPPKAIAKQRGYYRPGKHGDQIADVNALDWVYKTIPKPPEDLTEVAKNVWNAQLLQAQKMYGYISLIDLALFKEYCYVYGEIEFLKKTVTSKTYTDDKGTVRIEPLYIELNKLRKDFLRLSQEFGFSPSARTRIQLQQQPESKTDIYSEGI